MVFRKENVIERLKKLEAVLARLNEKAGFDFEEYQQNTDLQWIVERGLEVASSTILDLGNHILAGAFKTPADEYEQILQGLHQNHVLSGDVYKELKGLGGFRNILVHGYLNINPELVYGHYQKALKTFPGFIFEIEMWLEQNEQFFS